MVVPVGWGRTERGSLPDGPCLWPKMWINPVGRPGREGYRGGRPQFFQEETQPCRIPR